MDTPPNILHTSAFVQEARTIARDLVEEGVTVKVIRGEDLEAQGFGGLYGVGKAAVEPPALVVLSHVVSDVREGRDGRSVCFVGKGIVYDTGGLSIKTKTGMVNLRLSCQFAASRLASSNAMQFVSHLLHLGVCLCVKPLT